MVKFETLINPLILADRMVGFNGDSEFKDSDGELHMGSWTFVGIVDGRDIEAIERLYPTFTLEDDINEDEVFNRTKPFLLWSPREKFLTVVEIHYRDD